MINNTILRGIYYYYPLGNTPAVCLTQDLPPDQKSADILLLGNGDARNILFTCFADSQRKIDVTCCDIEPGIHARNILLYSLLLDDPANHNIDKIWNIYYHWKLDKASLEFLEIQVQKLLHSSTSMEEWHNSVYGSTLRFCDKQSLASVRCYWLGFTFQGLSTSQRAKRNIKLQAAIDSARADRKERMIGVHSKDYHRSLYPVQDKEAIQNMTKVTDEWWTQGLVPSSCSPSLKLSNLNPAFLYSPDEARALHYNTSPVLGFPLSTVYTPVCEGSTFFLKQKGLSPVDRIVSQMKNHFTQWAFAFTESLAKGSVIRIFSGDALAFCLTLRNCRINSLKRPRSMNLFCHNWTNTPLILDSTDYGSSDSSTAPLSFDIVDTSNLSDHLGPINLIPLASSLLKHNAWSSLYTENLHKKVSDVQDQLLDFFGVDVRAISLLLGLVSPKFFTNVTNSLENDPIDEVDKEIDLSRIGSFSTSGRLRLRWRRFEGTGCSESNGSPFVEVEAKLLARLLLKVHDTMFKHEDPAALKGLSDMLLNTANPPYNRASFAFFLHILKANVYTEWLECFKCYWEGIYSDFSSTSLKTNCVQDLGMHLNLFNVSIHGFPKPTYFDVHNAILAPLLPLDEGIPAQYCVTIRVPRKQLKVFTRLTPLKLGTPAIVCALQGADPFSWYDVFSSVQVMFGKWLGQTEGKYLHPRIKEDNTQLWGNADMFVSVLVPSRVLLQSKSSVPVVKCTLLSTSQNHMNFFKTLGPGLCFASYEMTSKDVFISRFMPGMSDLPTFVSVNDKQTKPATMVRLFEDASKVDTLTQRVTLKSEEDKAKLASKSSGVIIKFKSPLIASITVANSSRFVVEFPVPVSPSKYKMRIARKSSYIEVVSPLLDPLEKDAELFLFPFSLSKTACGINAPVPWSSAFINLEALPKIDVRRSDALSWLNLHAAHMFHSCEMRVQKSNLRNDMRTNLKNGLSSLLLRYAGVQAPQTMYFALIKDDELQTIILPSCLRLDLVNYTVVLDSAIIPLANASFSDPKMNQFLQELKQNGLCQLTVGEAENRAWRGMMPYLVERCRVWEHTSSCEYIHAGEIPIPEDGESPICTCGAGKFPSGDYLKDNTKKFSDLSYILNRYATQAAIAPVFSLYNRMSNSEATSSDRLDERWPLNASALERCKTCDSLERKDLNSGQQGLLVCSRCKMVKYCSPECQKVDWKDHKLVCKIVRL